MKKILCILSIFLLITAVSCSGKKASGEVAKLIDEVSQDISADEGGKIESETENDSVSIDIPAGALDENVKITMKVYDAKGYAGTDGLDVISKVVEFEPTGTIFKKPVFITMKSLENVGEAGRGAKKKVITAAVYRESEGKWSYSPTGAALKVEYSAGGDPIMLSAGGDPIMLNAAGDPIMHPQSGGDPIMLSAAGDPIMVSAAGDPIMQSAAGDPIMMTTGHFTSYAFLVVDLEAEAEPDDGITDNDITDDDISDIEDNDDTDDSDTDTHESSGNDPCEPNPCGSIENSNGVCHVIFLGREGDIKSFACDCIDSYGWDGLGCSPVDMSDPCESDPCADIVHSDGECHVVYNTDHVKTFSCGCEDPYFWDGEKCSSVCADEPCLTVQHTNGVCTPEEGGKYSCGCAKGYFWDGEKCVDPCLGNICGTVEHSTTECIPISPSKYECGCELDLLWSSENEKCANPCDSDPCAMFDGATWCEVKTADFYVCGCEDGLHWWGTEKGCLEEAPTFGRICTSQLKCYDNRNEIKCPEQGEDFYGQDAQYAALGTCVPKSFTIVDTGVTAEDIVYDNNTGLMWMRTPDGSREYGWSDASSYCNALDYGGYDDWRVPTPREYLTIVDNGRAWPTLDTNYFDLPEIPEGSYFSYNSWTSKKNVNGYNYWFWAVEFDKGELEDIANNSTRFVRCVRGEEMPESEFIIPDEFTETEEKIVVDTVTGLQWQYHDAQVTNHSEFWKGALAYCENLEYAGYDDWRLPNKDELMTIVDFGRLNPASSFPDIENVTYLLTSTTVPGESDAAFRLYPPDGAIISTWYKTNSNEYHVHCVRSE